MIWLAKTDTILWIKSLKCQGLKGLTDKQMMSVWSFRKQWYFFLFQNTFWARSSALKSRNLSSWWSNRCDPQQVSADVFWSLCLCYLIAPWNHKNDEWWKHCVSRGQTLFWHPQGIFTSTLFVFFLSHHLFFCFPGSARSPRVFDLSGKWTLPPSELLFRSVRSCRERNEKQTEAQKA